MATSTMNMNIINARTAGDVIKMAIELDQPLFLWGPSGIGKSEVIAQVAESIGAHMIDLRLGSFSPEDVRGYAFINKELGRMQFAPSSELPTEELCSKYETVILFLDEFNQTRLDVQSPLYQLILNRRIGEYVLPKNVRIIAAGNRASDRGATFKLAAPLANRFMHAEMGVDFESWHYWAINAGIDASIISFLETAPNYLFTYKPELQETVFASPRSWLVVNKIMRKYQVDSEARETLIAGTISCGVQIAFKAARNEMGQLPNIQQVLNGKITDWDYSSAFSRYTSMNSLLIEAVKIHKQYERKEMAADDYKNMIGNVWSFAMKVNPDEEVIAFISRLVNDHGVGGFVMTQLPTWREFVRRFAETVTWLGKYSTENK